MIHKTECNRIFLKPDGETPAFTELRLSADYEMIERLNQSLAGVQGQTAAIQKIKEYLFGLNRKQNEKGVGGLLTFMGPSGVGKTMVAEGIAKALGRPFLRLDMSGYNDKEAAGYTLFGINPSYKDSRKGLLTDFVEKNPVSVVLLDEFEKSHVNVKNVFLQIFERGECQDQCSQRYVSFRDVLIIATTNMGSALYDNDKIISSSISQNTLTNVLKSEINPFSKEPYLNEALISRLCSGCVVFFNHLGAEILSKIIRQGITGMQTEFKKRYGINIHSTDFDALSDLLVFNLGKNADARSAVKIVEDYFQKNLERLFECSMKANNFTEININVDFMNATADVKEVFSDNEKRNVLICCDAKDRFLMNKSISGNCELTFADEDISPEEIRKSHFNMAMIDGEKNTKGLFKELSLLGVPTYVYDRRSVSAEILYYIDQGATDVFHSDSESDFNAWVKDIFKSLRLSSVCKNLFRANKIIAFESKYVFNKENTAELIVDDIRLISAKEAEDVDAFVSCVEKPLVSLNDVYGNAAVKRQFKDMIKLFRNFEEFQRQGVRLPRGMLLAGPPGTGKTMLAKALAGESGMDIIVRNASEYLQKYVGEGPRIIREDFQTARKYAPCILFIDEVDAIAGNRQNDELTSRMGILNALLSEMDGFFDHASNPVFVIAATNFDVRKDSTSLDPAFLRRFDRRFYIDLPDSATRKTYLSAKLKNFKVSDRTIETLTKRSIGWSLAELDQVIQNALREGVLNEEGVTDEIIVDSFESYLDGESKSYDDETIKKTSIHEAGHAVVATLLGFPPSYATIKARAGYGGYVFYGNETSSECSKQDCLDRICIAMAGRAAEIAFYGEEKGVSSGASSDLKSATRLATSMVCDYGMDDELPIFIENRSDSLVKDKVVNILKEQTLRSKDIIQSHLEKVKSVSVALLEKLSLDEVQLKNILKEE